MIEPYLSDSRFIMDVKHALSSPNLLHIWWLGQSGFLLQWQNRHLLFDPYLSDSLTVKYAKTDKPHIRMTQRLIAPQALDFIDVVTSTHTHTDHLDAETLLPLLQANAHLSLVIPEANRSFVVDRLSCKHDFPLGLDDGSAIEVAGMRIHGVPAAHEQLDQDDLGRHRYLGFVVEWGPWTIYHSGDTVLYPGMVEKLRQWSIDVALLPINGRASERRVSGNLDGQEAAELAHAISAKLVIPCHYDMFTFNTASPDLFVATCEKLGQPYRVLQAGERVVL